MSGLIDFLQGFFFRFAASGYLPPSWFRKVDPADVDKARRTDKLSLEIVSHCWQYAHFLSYQLSSLVQYPVGKLDVTMTVFYAEEDEKVKAVLDFFSAKEVPNVTWNWRLLPKDKLFRRSIGRNLACKQTRSDWIWLTDCDIIFHEGCLDALGDELQGRDDVLVFPLIGLGTPLYEDDAEVLEKGRQGPAILEIPLDQFTPYGPPRKKAKGPYQILHGDIARACGYCADIGLYQRPSDRWRKTYEDRAFRWVIGSQGVPVDVPGACQIRHVAKGRYKKGSTFSRIRTTIRKSQE